MRQIAVILNVYEDIILEESGCETLGDAISQELGWLRDSGMCVKEWKYTDKEEKL